MEKSVQAIDIATVTPGNNANTLAKPLDAGATTPFAEVLEPAQAQTGQAATRQSAGPGGSILPDEPPLPASGLPQVALAGKDGMPSLSDLPVPEADAGLSSQAHDVTATVDDHVITVIELPVEHIVIEDVPAMTAVTERPPVGHVAMPVPSTGQQSPGVPVMPGEPVLALQETAMPGRRIDSGIPGQQAAQLSAQQQLQQPLPAQPATPGNGGMAADPVQAAVREGLQQALAAQVAQDGLRQSLSDNARNARILSGFTATAATLETTVASFAPVQIDAMNAVVQGRVAVPFGEAGWGRAVGEQVVWHVSQNIHAANLRLNPQHLGPLEMQVQMEGDKATLAFTSQHAVVRDALESALPRLREMFAQNGLNIVDVNVSQQRNPDHQGQESRVAGSSPGQEEEAAIPGEQMSGLDAGARASAGLVDYYI